MKGSYQLLAKVCVRSTGSQLRSKLAQELTDRPDMTVDVYRGRKTTNQQHHMRKLPSFWKVVTWSLCPYLQTQILCLPQSSDIWFWTSEMHSCMLLCRMISSFSEVFTNTRNCEICVYTLWIYTQNQCGSSMILVWNRRGLDHEIGRNRW